MESQRKKSLPLGDLNRLMTVPVKGEKLRKTQLALCLMFQYGGMSFVDFAHLNRGNIKNGILDYNRQKTGTSMRLEVLDTAGLCIRSWQVRGVEARLFISLFKWDEERP